MHYIFNKKNNSTVIFEDDDYFHDYILLNDLKEGDYVTFENEKEMDNFVSRYREVEIKKADHKSPSGYPTVYLTKDELDMMMSGIWCNEKNKLIKEIYNDKINNRKCG